MKKTSYLTNYLRKKDLILFRLVSDFLKHHFPEIYQLITSKKDLNNEEDDFVFRVFKKINLLDPSLFSSLEDFFFKEKGLTHQVFGNWAGDIQISKESSEIVLSTITENFDLIPIDIIPSLLQQANTLLFLSGTLEENSDRLGFLYKKTIDRFGSVSIKNTNHKEKRVHIFVSQIVWGSKHAPTLIVKNWIQILAPIFGTINVIVSPTPSYYLPLEKRFVFNNWYPKEGDLNVRFMEISPSLNTSNLDQILDQFINKNDILLSIGNNNFVFDRIKIEKKFLWPTVQYNFLHSSKYIFSFNNHQDSLDENNMFNEHVHFLPISSAGFCNLDSNEIILPSDRFDQKKHFESINLVTIGNRLALEMDQQFFDIIGSIAKLFKVKLTCIGIKDFNFPKMQNVSFQCVGYQSELETYVRNSDFDFFINPRRSGGGFGAVVSLLSGIPVLTLPYGDIFHMMKDFYYLNEEKDFLIFVKSFMSDQSFRKTISNLHLAINEASENRSNDPSLHPLTQMLNILEI